MNHPSIPDELLIECLGLAYFSTNTKFEQVAELQLSDSRLACGKGIQRTVQLLGHLFAFFFEVRYCRFNHFQPSSMSEFISAVEASKLTPISASTIKRFIRDVVDNPSHPSRDKIEPSVDELKRIQASGEPYRWRIDREFAVEHFRSAKKSEKGSGDSTETTDTVLEILREQLSQKDSQIKTLETQLDRKDDQLSQQNERMKDTHFLMQDIK